ncbi:KLHL5, partial [Symbiodinium necroappetens]
FLDGEFCVKDLGSTTGQFQIFPGLMIKLGETEMQVLSQNPSTHGMELSVMFYEGPFAGHKVTVPAAGITIGRVSDNTLVLLQDGFLDDCFVGFGKDAAGVSEHASQQECDFNVAVTVFMTIPVNATKLLPYCDCDYDQYHYH